MLKKFILLIFILFLPSSALADRLILKNGDILSGKILSITKNNTQISSSYAGEIKIPMLDIEHIEQGNTKWKVNIIDNTVELVNTPINNPQEGIKSQIKETTFVQKIEETEVKETEVKETEETSTAHQVFEDNLGLKTTGFLRASGNLQDGNSNTQSIKISGELKTGLTQTQRLTLRAQYVYGEENNTITDDEYDFDAIYDYFFDDRWFWNNNIGYEVDHVANLDYALNLGTGIGYQAFKRDDLNLSMALGPNFLVKEFKNTPSDETAALRWTLDYDQHFFNKIFKLYHNHEILQGIEESREFLFQSKTGFTLPLSKYWNGYVEIEYDFDNNAATGTEKEDTTYSIGLSYEW